MVGQDAREAVFQALQVGVDDRLGHPGDPEDGEHGGGPRLEHGRGGDLAGLHLAGQQDQCPGGEHDHLDDQVHAQALHGAVVSRGELGTQYLQGAQDDDDGDGAQEDPGGAVGLGREHLADEGLGAGVDGGAELRVLQALLVLLVLIQVLAPAHRPQGGQKDPAQRRRDGDRQDLED